MSQLSFRTEFHSSELQQLELPVEVRKPNMALVTRTLSTETVDVPPGTYHIVATLPAGVELYERAEVVADKATVVVLRPDPADVSPSESLEVQRYFVGTPVASTLPMAAALGLESLGPSEDTATLRILAGNPLAGDRLVGQLTMGDPGTLLAPQPPPERGIARFVCWSGTGRFVQLLQRGQPPLNLALPISPDVGCTLDIVRQLTGPLAPELHLPNVGADSTLRYYERGLLDQVRTAIGAISFERLLQQKMADPIAAAVGAYMLLRLGELDRLHDWTRNLANMFPWLPDGLALWGEHQARLGRHAEALTSFLQLPDRGLPIFSDGLSYTVDRLRLYSRFPIAGQPPESAGRAPDLLARLQQFADSVDFRKPILTFTGLDPSRPDDELLDPSAPASSELDGLDVLQHMG
ncbi:MAG: hypothetical protein U0X20_22845 [Caldilineaceae bacterium]